MAIAGDDQARLKRHGTARADRFEDAIFQDAQELRLQSQRKRVDLIQQERTTARVGESAGAIPVLRR